MPDSEEKVYLVEVVRTCRGYAHVIAKNWRDAQESVERQLPKLFSDIVVATDYHTHCETVEDLEEVKKLKHRAVMETDGEFVLEDWETVMRTRLGFTDEA